jgi:hypothetical protein
MLWLFRKLIDRLLGKAALVVGSTMESEMEMELSAARAELLRRARKLEQEDVPGFAEIAAELRAVAGRLGKAVSIPCADAVATISALAAEDLRTPEALLLSGEAAPSGAPATEPGLLPSPASRKRGRPKKDRSLASETEEIS